ncbi:CCHC-type domain-containing protein [Trichonephila clavipes]|nr:CCHC-type domain-containing protein [Trichonephila clavipes]
MPTEQEAKPAVVTPSLQQWRSPSTFRGAPGEDPLKWLKEQWYVNNEDALDSWEAFKNGLSGLFGDRQKYTRRAEEQLKCRAQRSKTDVWRTADNRPVCFHCGRPDIMRYCREKRLSLTTPRNRRRNFDDVGTEEEIRRPKLLAVLRQVPREADPQYVVTDPRRHIADPVSRQAVGARKTKESDLPRRMGLLEASQAVIDCGQNELVLEDICRDSTAPDA